MNFRKFHGFTLIEMLLVITLLGTIGVISVLIILTPLQVGMDMNQRARMVDNADLALAQMSHELRSALPHSVRIDDSKKFMEFIPVIAAGRYRRAGAGYSLNIDIDEGSGKFDVLGPELELPTQIDLNKDQLFISIYNTPLYGHDAYRSQNIVELSHLDTSYNRIEYKIPDETSGFSTHSPAQRFYLFKGPGPVSYRCEGSELRRHENYERSPSQTDPIDGTSNLLLSGLKDCEFKYRADLGLVEISITVQDAKKPFELFTRVAVINSP
ncbi:PulJ/GspJ family protein [Ectothiorhodospira variabilis]|uniref:PulJ/GspJ family protein n=1 Tax=Ectothiorhodospira variabilis TaxID=505694 RepID=UPI001EFB1E6F|nr:type II secretion system protein [Ectothiorhodospira variabilis]MCG5498540.1 type II secretion system GspH family protein [Ectothiorhodospira variabilis]